MSALLNISARTHRLAETIKQAGIPSSREEIGLPRLAQEILRKKNRLPGGGKSLRPLISLADRLDLQIPGWPEAAAQMVLSGDGEGLAQTAAGLLALRPQTSTLLCRALVEPETPQQRELAALALFNTDRAEARAAYREAFAQLRGERFAESSSEYRALWLIFARLAQDKTLSFDDLYQAVINSALFQPEGYPKGGKLSYYHPSLDASGISQQPEFRRLYAILVAEILPSVTADNSPWFWLRWIRNFPGADYFFEALTKLERELVHLPALMVLRWARDLGEETPQFRIRLAGGHPQTLMLAALLRPQLAELIGEVLEIPDHGAALRWLNLPCREAAAGLGEPREKIFAWGQSQGRLLFSALEMLCALEIPLDEPIAAGSTESDGELKLQRFITSHLLPTFPNLLDNLLLLEGLLGLHLERLEAEAGSGRLAALRALGLAENISERGMRLLLEQAERGTVTAKAAARWALAQVLARHGLRTLGELKAKLDLAAAWEDAGMAQAPSRVWWDVAGHRVKLGLEGGKVEIQTWGPARKKNLPPAVRAHPHYREVQAAAKVLQGSYRLFRGRLEEEMLADGRFSSRRFQSLFTHPAFRNIAERLVLCFDKKELVLDGMRPEDLSELLAQTRLVQVANPLTLLFSGRLEYWQETLSRRHIIQPFKQCFRELYPVEPEESGALVCRRFAEQLILPRKAYALLKQRGYAPAQGKAYRDWPEAGLRAYFVWAQENEELWRHLVGKKQAQPLTTGEIYFERLEEKTLRPTEKLSPLGEVDKVLFSETLRDADLVVSAAAAGEEGFSSRQTLEIRAALVRNFAKMLNLPGVKIEPGSAQAVIKGERASYRLHLGSGRVLMEPTGRHLSLPITGALEMPLAAEEKKDSRTIAILETVAALSHDAVISDPQFLAALRVR
jgi:hypothetical protein